GFLGISQLFDWMQTQAAYMVPSSAMDQANRILSEIQQPHGGLLSLGIVLALWAASAAARGTINALNIAYDVKERRPAWKRVFLSVAYTAGLAFMLLCAAAMMVTGPSVAEWIVHYAGLNAMFVMVWTWLRWPVTVVLLLVVVSTVYYAAPNARHPFHFFTPGSLLAVSLWIAASAGFRIYVQNFGNYSETYGSIGAIIVLVFYFYISSAVLLFGGEVNAAVDHLRDQPPKAQA
ncbi:MAG: YihY/virulence factor BrkB family protein, partial [Burkholderiales bacterium]